MKTTSWMTYLTALLWGAPATAGDCDGWAPVAPWPGLVDIEAMATDGVRVVAVGLDGGVLSSDDGLAWRMGSSGTSEHLFEVVWAGDRFVAAGAQGTVLTSADGLAWAPQTPFGSQTIHNLAWSGAELVTIAADGTVWHSPDGAGWVADGVALVGQYTALRYADGVFAAVGPSTTPPFKGVQWSTDGVVWTPLATTSASGVDIAWSGTEWALAGDLAGVYLTTDRLSWTWKRFQPALAASPVAIGWHLGQYILAGGAGQILVSADGATWTPATAPSIASLTSATRYGAEVLVGGHGTTVLASDDGVSWAGRTHTVASQDLNGGLHTNGHTVVVGAQGTVASSTNSVDWVASVNGNGALRDVAFNGSAWVATGRNVLLSSPDAIAWSAHANPLSNRADFTGTASNGVGFVAASGYGMIASADGTSWSLVDAGEWSDVLWDGARYVAVGYGATTAAQIGASADGTTWTVLATADWNANQTIAYGDGRYVVGGGQGAIYVSLDGVAWSQAQGAGSGKVSSLGFDGTRFIALQVGTPGVLTSPDGYTWTESSSSAADLNAVVAWDGGSVLLGASGVVSASAFPAVCPTSQDVTVVAEGGASNTLELRLNRAPTAPVTVAIVPDAQIAVAPSSLVFGPSDWDVAQSVTVSAVDDVVDEGEHTGVLGFAVSSSDAFYDGLAMSDRAVTVLDDDVAGIAVLVASPPLSVSEDGGVDSYSLALSRAPTANVTVDLISDGQLQAVPAALTFELASWDTPQAVQVQAVDDAIVEIAHKGSLAHSVTSDDAGYDGLAMDDVEANIADNDVGSIVVTETGGGTLIGEGGPSDTIAVSLGAQPVGPVTLAVGDTCQDHPIFVNSTYAAPIHFTPEDWQTPQTLELTTDDDSMQNGAERCRLNLSVLTPAPGYTDALDTWIEVTVADNDTAPGLVLELLSHRDEPVVNEYTSSQPLPLVVRATTLPTADVVFTVEGDGELNVMPDGDATAIQLLAAKPGQPAAVLVRATDDDLVEGLTESTLVLRSVSDDPLYDGLTASMVLTIDDDDVGVISDAPRQVELTEGGASVQYSLRLSQAPTADVTAELVADERLARSPQTVTWTAEAWDAVKTVELSVPDDDAYLGDVDVALQHVITSADADFAGSQTPDIALHLLEDDAPPVDTGGEPEPRGCGCSSAPSGSQGLAALWPLLWLLSRRRR